jgi:hypothetical protein
MIDRQEARSDVARIDPAADRWLHTANRARATTDPRVGRLVKSPAIVKHFEWPVFHVSLDGGVIEATPNKTFGIYNLKKNMSST